MIDLTGKLDKQVNIAAECSIVNPRTKYANFCCVRH
ncbi:MAG: hypothetical protein FD118_4122 [Rhodocyclaceae bacterium]|nr:MAG: hypothetical protein FD118_4122 [Rhodocyclaceae bacterium]